LSGAEGGERKPGAVKATDLLTRQHREVEKLFARIEAGKGDKRALATEIAKNLLAHMIIEQVEFYPATSSLDEDLVLEAYEEHAVARYEIRRMLDSDEGRLDARATTLKELIEHHVKEEESELFPKVEKHLDGEKLRAMGAKMEALFNELVAQGLPLLLERSRRTGEAGASSAAT
jgi:hemerythrin superfamily protein